ncbi:hypothetical protein [Arenibacter certesii]|uniref:Uncharacterized protein n=1 Tax=Arenibacter certesii TaxID=228955 RepID=A0A918MS61_9FLAO|nr:hypothetical protein [Arenibacter certesii]GGW50233.1 hypothetical protein GCM10007383_37630 [Arenibacter certesii]
MIIKNLDLKIKKEDIPVLKVLLSELVKPINSNGIDFSSLPGKFKQDFTDNNKLDTEFRRFANIFDKSGAGKFKQSTVGWALILVTPNSYGFDFDSFYKRINREERREKFEFNISKIKSKTYVPMIILGAFGGVYSLWNLLKDFEIIKTSPSFENRKTLQEEVTIDTLSLNKIDDSIQTKKTAGKNK